MGHMLLCVWRCVGVQFADVTTVNQVAHGGGGVIVTGVCYERQTSAFY